MAKNSATIEDSREILSGPRPSHLSNVGHAGGPGRSRVATEFDDQVLEWYKDDQWKGIASKGETDEEKAHDFEENFKAVKRAADFHGLGIERIRDEENKVVWVNIRDKQSRGPQPGSIRDPETNKMVKPGTDRYEEIMASRNGDANPNVVPEEQHDW
jgi:hypothetical protein